MQSIFPTLFTIEGLDVFCHMHTCTRGLKMRMARTRGPALQLQESCAAVVSCTILY